MLAREGDGGEAYAPGTYADVAVQVTIHEWATSRTETMGSLNTAELIAHSSNGGELRCGFGPIGTWFLMRYSATQPESDQWSVLAFGQQNHDVHWGLGMTNTLLLVAHGARYWCYVNGHLLGSGTDSIAQKPGRVGVYLDDNTIFAAFNDFRVYRVPAGMYEGTAHRW